MGKKEKSSRMFDYWKNVKKQVMDEVMNVIKDNDNIKDKVLVAKLHVDSPYLSKKRGMEMIADLKLAGKITVNSNGEISLCL